jgi:hypothetical protein
MLVFGHKVKAPRALEVEVFVAGRWISTRVPFRIHLGGEMGPTLLPDWGELQETIEDEIARGAAL